MKRIIKDKRYYDEYQFTVASIYWAHIAASYKKYRIKAPAPEIPVTKYNVYANALTGDDTNSGLDPNNQVRTLQRVGNVMRGLPADRETLGTTVFLWGSDLGNVATHFKDYNDLDIDAGVPKSAFIGLNNYLMTSNPNSGMRAIINGLTYDVNDPRRVAIQAANSTHHFRPTLLYLEGSGVTLDNIEFITSAGSCVRHEGNNGMFRRLEVHDTNSDALFHSGRDTIFEYNHIFNVNENLSSGRIGDAIRIQFATRPVIRYNVVHNLSSEAFNFDDGTVDGLIYLNDAYEIGFPNGWGATEQPVNRTGNAIKLSASNTRYVNTRNAAIANRLWRNLRDFYTVDGSDSMILYNAMRLTSEVSLYIRSNKKITIGNNLLGSGATIVVGDIVKSVGGELWPSQRSNSWANINPNSDNLSLVVSTDGASAVWRDVNYPTTLPPATGFSGSHILPIESKFANVAKVSSGWGKHVGPVDAVVAELRTMTPQQIRDRLALHR